MKKLNICWEMKAAYRVNHQGKPPVECLAKVQNELSFKQCFFKLFWYQFMLIPKLQYILLTVCLYLNSVLLVLVTISKWNCVYEFVNWTIQFQSPPFLYIELECDNFYKYGYMNIFFGIHFFVINIYLFYKQVQIPYYIEKDHYLTHLRTMIVNKSLTKQNAGIY